MIQSVARLRPCKTRHFDRVKEIAGDFQSIGTTALLVTEIGRVLEKYFSITRWHDYSLQIFPSSFLFCFALNDDIEADLFFQFTRDLSPNIAAEISSYEASSCFRPMNIYQERSSDNGLEPCSTILCLAFENLKGFLPSVHCPFPR